MRREGRFLKFLVEIAIFDRVLGGEIAVGGGFGEGKAARRPRSRAIGERDIVELKPSF